MSKNNRVPKKVRAMKGEEPKATSQQVEVINGNTALLTVKFLSSINEQLIEIKNLLKETANG